MNTATFSQWDSRLFLIAGSCLLINTIMLWVRYFSNYQLSILWAAIPAIVAFILSILGQLTLHRRIFGKSWAAKIGAGFAWLACASLFLATIWIIVLLLSGNGIPSPAPQALLALIALFMISMVVSFLANGMAFLKQANQRKTGALLMVPVCMWGQMLIVGMFKGMEVALSLDFYSNGVIAVALVALGKHLKSSANLSRQ